ncbi:chromosome segregation protein SMC [Myxococcota bacterium]|nr:chromosome segregation protein SMC [Myxococcota bacterium]MBU1381822.1 chromosome segregation protein SMC [Myxococcota bacterium]MBU1498599.1 chromosome segregation protein SMC [Myxococcota bacterium]
MYLKRLELHGFKSFSGKSQLDFEGRINAVVGPNGCGKSNIVDAIKWALGEQSAKSLRGRGMEDVIFAGTTKKPPTGMAEVKLVFAREDNEAPLTGYLDFPEITVSRILHRDGGSEYRLQNIPCRLRDIADVFLGTGLGSKSYSIIEQGKIGSIIISRPEERRVLFEEAARITRYRARRREAEKRLEESQANLLRITDVVIQMEKRTKQLFEQKETALRYENLCEQRTKLEACRISHEYLGLLLVHRKNLAEVAAMEEVIGEKKATAEVKNTNLAALILKRQNLQSEITESVERLIALEKELSQLEASKKVAENTAQTLRDRRRTSESERRLITEKIVARNNFSQEIRDKITHLEAVVSIKEDDFKRRETAFTTMKADVVDLEAKLRIQREKYLALKTSRASLDAEISTLKGSAISSNERLGKLETLIEEKKMAVNLGRGKLKDFETNLAQIAEKKKAVQSYIEGISDMALDLEEKKSVLGRRKQKIVEKVSELSGRKAFLEKAVAKTGSQEEIDTLCDEIRSQAGILLEPVLESLTVREGAANHLQFILESELEYLTVSDNAINGNILESLRNAGIAGLLLAPDDSTESTDFNADGLVSCADFLIDGPLSVMEILKSWYFTDDRELALSVWDNLPQGISILCKEEFIIDYAGRVKFPRKQTSNILAFRMDLEKTLEEFETADSELRSLNLEIEKNNTELEEFRRREKASLSELMDLTRLRDENLKNTERLTQLITFSESQIEESEIERQSIMNSIEKTGIDERTSRLRNVEAEIEKFESYSMTLDQNHMEKLENLNALREELTEIRVGLETWKGKLGVEKANLIRVREEIEKLDGDIVNLDLFMEVSQGKLEEISAEIANLNAQSLETATKLGASRGEQGDLRTKLEEMDKEAESLRSEIRLIETNINKDRDVLERLRMASVKTRNSMENLENQYRENTGADLKYDLMDFHAIAVFNDEMKRELSRTSSEINKLQPYYNPSAIREYNELYPRFEYMTSQRDDLTRAIKSLEEAIAHITEATRNRFFEAFDSISERFSILFPKLFGGGSAKLVLGPGDPLEAGIEIIAQPPGKKVQNMELLSGGEKAMTAIALVFSMFLYRPTPFCILDEVDAPLDEANVEKYNLILREMSLNTQFIVITHNRRTMEGCDVLFGVTMDEPGISKVLKLNVSEAQNMAAQR